MNTYFVNFKTIQHVKIESIKTTSMENVSTEVLGKNKEHYLRSGDKAKKYDILRQILSYMSKYK